MDPVNDRFGSKAVIREPVGCAAMRNGTVYDLLASRALNLLQRDQRFAELYAWWRNKSAQFNRGFPRRYLGRAVATAGSVLDMPVQLDCYLGLAAKSEGTSEIFKAVQHYLASWSEERIANVQKIDAGWAPFDIGLRPLQVNGAIDVRCIRDAIRRQCMALREASFALSPELMELDNFFFIANEMIENSRRIQLQLRTPAAPAHHDVIANWWHLGMFRRNVDFSWLGPTRCLVTWPNLTG